MLCILACLLLVACVHLVLVRSDLDEKNVSRSSTDIHKASQWAKTHLGFAKHVRHLSEYRSDEHANPSTRENEMEGNRGTQSEANQGKDDNSNDETRGEYATMRGEKKGTEFEKDHMGKSARDKKCDGVVAENKGKRPRNLHARDEHEAEPESECNEEDDGLGLLVTLGIVWMMVHVFSAQDLDQLCAWSRCSSYGSTRYRVHTKRRVE